MRHFGGSLIVVEPLVYPMHKTPVRCPEFALLLQKRGIRVKGTCCPGRYAFLPLQARFPLLLSFPSEDNLHSLRSILSWCPSTTFCIHQPYLCLLFLALPVAVACLVWPVALSLTLLHRNRSLQFVILQSDNTLCLISMPRNGSKWGHLLLFGPQKKFGESESSALIRNSHDFACDEDNDEDSCGINHYITSLIRNLSIWTPPRPQSLGALLEHSVHKDKWWISANS